MDGEVHEGGEELNEDKEKDLDGIKLEVVEGNKEGSRWLIVDSVHICHKQQVFLNVYDVWRCEEVQIEIGQTDEGRLGHTLEKDMG